MSIKLQGKVRYARFLLGSLCFLGLVFSPCSRSVPGASASTAQSGRTFSLRVEVELVTVEVIALDKKGKPVRDLKKEDFRLYEDGKKQEIVSFDEVNGEPRQALTTGLAYGDDDIRRGKTVLILFDDSTITPSHLKSTRDSAERFAKEHMQPQDLFAVVSYNLTLRVLQNFTDDPEKILAAIRQPAVAGGTSPQISATEQSQRFPGRNVGASPSYNPVAEYQAESLFRALDFLNRSIERVKGRKSILLFSEDTSLSANSHYLFRNTVDSARKANVVFYTIDARGLDWNPFGEIRTPAINPQSHSSKTDHDAFLPAKSAILQLPVAWSAQFTGIENRARNAMFQRGGGGGTSGGTGSGGTGSTGGGTGGATGGGTGGRGGTGGNTGSGATSGAGNTSASYPGRTPNNSGIGTMAPDFRTDSARMVENILRSLALETGGAAIYNTGDFNGELDKLDQQISNYYILGFQSSNPKRDGSFRKLEVKTDLKGVTLKYRKGYTDRRPLDTLTSSKQEKSLLSAMASPTRATQLPLAFRAVYFYDSPRLARVLVSARIHLGKAKFKKKRGQQVCDLNVMGAAYAENDSVAARFSEKVTVTVDKEKEQDFGNNLLYNNYFKLRPGKYRLKLAASDESNNLGSMEQLLEIPALPENGISGSSLVVMESAAPLPMLIQNIEARLLEDSDPLVYEGLQISPSIDNKLPINASLPVLFKLYSPAGELDRWKIVATAKLVKDTGEELSLLPFTLEENVPQADNTEATLGFRMTFQGVSPGKYTLIIETTDAASSHNAVVQTDVEFVEN